MTRRASRLAMAGVCILCWRHCLTELVSFVGTSRKQCMPPSTIRLRAEPDITSSAWDDSIKIVLEHVKDSTKEDALEWLQAGFAWTQKSRRFWRKLRLEAEPEPEVVRSTVRWLKEKGLAQKGWVRKFPEVLGLSMEELEEGRMTAPSYLKNEETYNKAIKSNPQLLGKNYDCLLEHESCQGRCSRCWNT
mmetsp:Transcript_51083/g.95677  ORF Transcript_51083/g.95677 Transcript_51083/m.95677 type:complete len:190 (-) Transcript_51083:238-807(-)